MKLRVMTYNVHRCVGTDKRLDVERVAEVIASLKPDVVCLQELDVGRQRTRSVDQAHRLGELLAMRSHFHAAMTIEEELYGDAILTHLPEVLVRKGPLPGYPRVPGLEPRGAVWISVKLADGKGGVVDLQIINTHLGLIPKEQQRQVAALVGDWMAADEWVSPGIVVGDFNATPRSTTYRMLAASLKDCQTGRVTTATFPSKWPFMRIDHMFMTPGVRVVSVESPYDPRAKLASDHLPLLVELEIEAQAKPA
jgi:endonuclease/exonuclease/phosphatase family metal-dependent hydrolase